MRLAPELQIFHDVGKAARAITAEGGTYSLKKIRERLPFSRDEIRVSLKKIHGLFCLYYGTYGHPPYRAQPFEPEDPSRDVHESKKLFHLGPNGKEADSRAGPASRSGSATPTGGGPGI